MSQNNDEYYMEDNKCILWTYTICLCSLFISFIIGALLFIINYDKIFSIE